MILLQASSGAEPVILIFTLLLRIVGAVVCVNKAKELNRSTGGWGFFGFFLPVIAMIWVHCIKPKVVWDSNVETQTKS